MPHVPEIAELIADIKEQVHYLQELGVDAFEMDLQRVSASPASARESQAPAAPSSERKIPELITPPKSAPAAESTRRTAGSRLASLPSLSNRKPTTFPSTSGTVSGPIENNEVKVESKTTVEPDGSLFEIGPALPETTDTIESIRSDIGNCTRCPLFEGRTQVVHTTGNFNADLMFIGDAPGADEDAQGFPFVGRAGQLLTKIIESIGLKREEVAIGNINRCRPPGNRAPTLPEAHTCRPFLLREIAVIRPKVIVVMGNTALHNLLDTKAGITRVRGSFQDYFGVKVMPTFHPAYLLRDPHKKREVWEDMKMVRDYLNSLEG